MNHPRPETTPGVFLEHFDLCEPMNGQDSIVYRSVYDGAKEAAALYGWTFRSCSSANTPCTREEFLARGFRSFPTLILYRDGIELGRLSGPIGYGVGYVQTWAGKLLGIETEELPPPAVPAHLRERSTITPSGEILKREHDSSGNGQPPLNEDSDPDLMALREVLERHFVSGEPLEIIYFGGSLPGARRVITPLRYCESRGRGHLIGHCHRSGIEKTFRLDRMHLPAPPLADGTNDFRIIGKCLGSPRLLEGMLAQIARLGNLPMENALAEHLAQAGDFESFFDEYAYGGYTLELNFTSSVIYLSLGYEAHECETIHYEFTPASEPRLTPGIATHYSLYLGRSALRH